MTMDYKWSLDALYTSLEDEHFLADWKKLEELCECHIGMVGVGPDRTQQLER